MHITLIIIAFQACHNVYKQNPDKLSLYELLETFSICGDDSSYSNELVYLETKKLYKQLGLIINESKSYTSNTNTRNNEYSDVILFGEFLKKYKIGSDMFCPISPRSPCTLR